MAEPGPSRQRQADLALIRAARPAEAGALTALALAAKAHWGYPASFMARCRAALTIEPAMIRRHVFRLAEGEDGVILGFYGFEPDPRASASAISSSVPMPSVAASAAPSGRMRWLSRGARAMGG